MDTPKPPPLVARVAVIVLALGVLTGLVVHATRTSAHVNAPATRAVTPEGAETYALGLTEPWPKGYLAQLVRPLLPTRTERRPDAVHAPRA